MASYSNKIKVNTRASTETEVVAVDRYMPKVLWTMYFLREQGYPVRLSKIAQDNEAAQLLETRGRFSSTRRTKHFKNKLFFVKDQVDQGEIAIVDCPTGKMWADFLSKPQQGALFKLMRSLIMGCEEDYVDPLDPQPKSRERICSKENSASSKDSGATRVSPRAKVSAPRLFPLMNRASSACPSAQECVGQRGGSITKKVTWAGNLGGKSGNVGGRRPLTSANRSWRDVVAGATKPPRII